MQYSDGEKRRMQCYAQEAKKYAIYVICWCNRATADVSKRHQALTLHDHITNSVWKCCFVCLPKSGPDGATRHVAKGGAARKLGAYVTFGAHRHVTAIRKSRRVLPRRSQSQRYQMSNFICCQAFLQGEEIN